MSNDYPTSDAVPFADELAAETLGDLPGSARFVYMYLRVCGPCTQGDLVSGTQYTRSTIRTALGELRECDLLIESPVVGERARTEYRADPGPLYVDPPVSP